MSIPTRTGLSRDANARRSIGGEAKGSLEIDMTGLPPDMEACWIREMILGQRDDNNIGRALDIDGYEVVPPSLLPHARSRSLPGMAPASDADQIIRRSGHVLMMRPKQFADEDRAAQREEVQQQKNAAIRVADASGARMSDGADAAFREAAPAVSVRGPGRPRGFKQFAE